MHSTHTHILFGHCQLRSNRLCLFWKPYKNLPNLFTGGKSGVNEHITSSTLSNGFQCFAEEKPKRIFLQTSSSPLKVIYLCFEWLARKVQLTQTSGSMQNNVLPWRRAFHVIFTSSQDNQRTQSMEIWSNSIHLPIFLEAIFSISCMMGFVWIFFIHLIRHLTPFIKNISSVFCLYFSCCRSKTGKMTQCFDIPKAILIWKKGYISCCRERWKAFWKKNYNDTRTNGGWIAREWWKEGNCIRKQHNFLQERKWSQNSAWILWTESLSGQVRIKFAHAKTL